MVKKYGCQKGCRYESTLPQTLRWASFQNKEVFFCHGLESLTADRRRCGGPAWPPMNCPQSRRPSWYPES